MIWASACSLRKLRSTIRLCASSGVATVCQHEAHERKQPARCIPGHNSANSARVSMTGILEAGHRCSSATGFLIELGLDLEMRHTRLNQVEREWIVIRCVKTIVYLPAVYLNRAAHERPVYLS